MRLKTLVHKVQDYALHSPKAISCVFLEEGGNSVKSITYQELDHQARLVADFLLTENLSGKQVLLLYPAGIEFISSLLGCLYAGVVAVPVHCPEVSELDNAAEMIATIANDADVAAVLTQKNYKEPLKTSCKALFTECRIITAEQLFGHDTHATPLPSLSPQTLVYLQYTSGSTAFSKGVVINHQNLTHSLVYTARAWQYSQHSVMLTWASHAHVYGLICGLLMPLYHGSTTIIIPPLAFIKNPICWLRAIDKYQVTHSGCPNFGYDLCVQHIKSLEKEALNLSSWKVAVNGGETIRKETLEKFYALCSSSGFKIECFQLAYGMSEATGLIASTSYLPPESRENSHDIPSRDILSLGKALPKLKVITIHPENTTVLKEGEIGEICLQGPSITNGYWQRSNENKAAFVSVGLDQSSYLRTGDLGYLKKGEMFITGRLKEIIVVYGKKYHSLDLEFTAMHSNQESGEEKSCVVFSTQLNNREEIVVVQEVKSLTEKEMLPQIVKSIRRAISQQYLIDIYGVVLVAENTIPRTASGKLQRRLCQQRYLEHQLPILFAHYKQLEDDVAVHSKEIKKQSSTVIDKVKADLTNQVAVLLRLPIAEVNLEDHLSEYGFDSITITQFISQLNDKYHLTISPALFFEYKTLDEFCHFLCVTYESTLISYYSSDLLSEKVLLPIVDPSASIEFRVKNHEKLTFSTREQDIAIIGMSGSFPGADNLQQFWQLLLGGNDAITEIPESRWRWQEYYGDVSESHKTNVKWGGFIHNVDLFDAEFFNISRHEAELMDPQQRLFLQTVWRTIEDAGYAPKRLGGSKVGVFVGVSASDYSELLQKNNICEAHSVTGSVFSILANRISYLLDFRGPSEAIDTACSSSLVAIEHAIQSIHQGDSEMAIAGGVNLLLTPRLFLAFSRAKMLSEDGRCKTFDETANGYVRGEGVGAVLLKPLKKAIAHHDHIYGVIKGCAINHGGRVKSLTVPNPHAQAEVITKAITRANISAETISYIETHGTGTALGDPIEVNGLKKAFHGLMPTDLVAHPFCGIGSVKTNIGHLEAAAGIAGLIKVLLAMQHKILPASLHCHQLNPHVILDNSPFYLLNQSQSWKKSQEVTMPYRAGISSFGFGGVNAHLVIEEAPAIEKDHFFSNNIHLIGISAKTQKALYLKLVHLVQWLKENPQFTHLGQLAYTLNTGRDHFKERIVIVADSVVRLLKSLQDALDNQLVEKYITSEINDTPKLMMETIAQAYLEGESIDWMAIYAEESYEKMALPTYPFEGERYWFDSSSKNNQLVERVISMDNNTYYTNLVFTNESTSDFTLFKTIISGKSFFIKDHVFNEKAVLPGVFYIEVARVVASLAYPNKTLTSIKKIVWLRPLILAESENIDLWVKFYSHNEAIRFEIFTELTNKKYLHAQGELSYARENSIIPSRLSFLEIISRLKKHYKKDKIYNELLLKLAFNYGPSYQSIETIQHNENELLAKITLPDLLKNRVLYGLNPGLLDGCIQALVGLKIEMSGQGEFGNLAMPFSIEEIIFYKTLSDTVYSYAVKSQKIQVNTKSASFDLLIVDENGECLIKINGLNMRQADNSLKLFSQPQIAYYYDFQWKSQPITLSKVQVNQLLDQQSSVIIFSDNTQHFNNVYPDFLAHDMLVIQVNFAEHYSVNDAGKYYHINPSASEDYQKLLQDLKMSNVIISNIIYLPTVRFLNPAHKPSQITLLDQGIFSVFLLTQALLKEKSSKEINLLYCYQDNHVTPWNAMVSGFVKTIIQENPHYKFHLLALPNVIAHEELSNILCKEFACQFTRENSTMISYASNQRCVQVARQLPINSSHEYSLKENGVYLITGGLGGIGFIIAKFLTSNANATLVLIGRSDLSEKSLQKLIQLKNAKNQVEYMQGDVTDEESMRRIMLDIKNKFGHLNGVFHCAGLTEDGFIIKKDLASFSKVLAPKVLGTYYLDQFTQQEPLDYFVLFSSVAGVFGNIGQSDYASANAFLDQFSSWRNQQVDKGMRQGHTLSIDWPVWEEGGMQVDAKTKEWMAKTKGVTPILTSTALNAFVNLLNQKHSQVAVITGELSKIQDLLLDHRPSLSAEVVKILDDIKTISAMLLKADITKLDVNTDLSQYGLDSMIMLDMLSQLDKKYDISLSPTAFSDYPTLTSLAGHIVEEIKSSQKEAVDLSSVEITQKNINPTFSNSTISSSRKIAVISVACRFPKSPNVEAYWNNLVNECSLIRTGIPPERWNHALYYDSDKTASMKTYANWGGFVDNVNLFDAKFFGISELDAYCIDPQQRIMLEIAQELFDRAGYSRDEMSGKPVSVIIAGTESHYGKKFLEETPVKAEVHQIVNRIGNMIASRISDFYNLTSFSHTLDAACSASLLAIHHACNSIFTGDAEMAIAGGSEFLLDPIGFVGFSKAGVLSDDGIGYVFDQRAKGFVMAEGFGLMLFKDYDAAMRDGDQILATILATATNNDGRTVGITTPNGKAQKHVMQTALARSNISPETITYLEAHGTGTLLGDPIEIKAASEVYGSYSHQKNYCAVASVKSNMGHTLRAAGIASAIKVVLALQNKFIPATLNCETPHPRFQFEKSPFYPITKGKQWASALHHPRRAAVSAFGFGGTNVHAILEEHVQQSQKNIRTPLPPTPFNRQDYWLGNIKTDYKEILRHLKSGKIDGQLAARLLQKAR